MTAVSPAAIARHKEAKRVASRRAKRKRTGVCVDCGTVTRYNGHKVAVSQRCNPCASSHRAAKTRGTGHTQQHLFALLREHGELRFTEITVLMGRSKGHTGQLVHRLVSYGLIERARRGVYRLPGQP